MGLFLVLVGICNVDHRRLDVTAPNQAVNRTEIQQWSPKNVYLAHRRSAAAYLFVELNRFAVDRIEGNSPMELPSMFFKLSR